MNNPIGRMPNPMAVPPIPPMGVNPTAQNPSAMAMPVVTQPKVDMQMMGTSPEKRKKFNDLMDSLSAPRQPMIQTFQRGGNVQYLKGGGPTMPSGKYSYSKNLNDKIAKLIGGAITTPEEERFKSPPIMGMAESGSQLPAMYMAAPVNPYNKNIGYNVEQGLPENDPLLTQGQNVKVGMKYEMNPLYQDRNIIDTSFMAGQRGKLDQMRAENRKPTFYDAMRGMYYNQKPPILDVPILPMQSGPDIDPIIPAKTTFEDDYVFDPAERFDPDYIKFLKEMSGIGSFANGGPVQYLKGGGPSVIKEKDFNKDTTIPDTVSKIGNFFSNLFSGGKSVDTGYGDLTKPGSAFPGSDLNFSEPPKIPTLEGNIVKRVPRGPAFERGGRGTPPLSSINMDILDMPAPMDIPSLTNVVKDVAPPVSPLNIGQYDIVKGMTEADKAFPASDFVADLVPAPQYLQSQKSFMPITSAQMPQANVTDPLEPFGGAGQYPESILYGDRFDPFKTSTPPARRDVFKDLETLQKAQAEAAAKDQSGQTNQQGFGIGKLLPLIVGMFNPTAGMALGIMQAMGGQGEGEGLLGGILPNLAKTLGIGDTERTFGDYTFRSLEDPRSGESAGMTPEERRELFLKNQASNERNRAGREMQETIDAITKPTVPDPVLGEDGTYSCPLPYVYDPNTKVCVMMEAGLGGQGAAANETKPPIAMQMGGSVDPNLNMAVDNFIQALA